MTEELREISGSIEVWEGDDRQCIRRIAFEEAYLYEYREEMSVYSWQPAITNIVISPMRLDIDDLRLDRRWPKTTGHWTKYEEEKRQVKSSAARNARIVDAYWIDRDNKRRDLVTNFPVKLYIELEDFTAGQEVNFQFKDGNTEGWSTVDVSGTVGQNGIVTIDDFQLKNKYDNSITRR